MSRTPVAETKKGSPLSLSPSTFMRQRCQGTCHVKGSEQQAECWDDEVEKKKRGWTRQCHSPGTCHVGRLEAKPLAMASGLHWSNVGGSVPKVGAMQAATCSQSSQPSWFRAQKLIICTVFLTARQSFVPRQLQPSVARAVINPWINSNFLLYLL
jgi:hypothetical protein